MVVQVGDLHNWDTPEHDQYERSTKAFAILDQAGLPYVLTLGNHDTAATKVGGSAAPGNVHDNNRVTTTFNRYYPLSRFKALQGVFEAGKMDNAFHTFRAADLDWLVLNLELWPRAEAVAWARTVVEAHPHHNVLLVTHSYLTGRGAIEQRNGGYGDNSPQYVADQLVRPFANVRLVLCGHTGSHTYAVERGADGHAVHQFLQCYHDRANPVRLLEINPRAGTIKSRVHVPSLGQDKEDGSTFTVTDVAWVQPAAATAQP